MKIIIKKLINLSSLKDGYIIYDDSTIYNIEQILSMFSIEDVKRRGWFAGKPLAGRGNACFFTFKKESFVLRYFMRGGFISRISINKYIWCGIKKTRAYREFVLLRYLFDLGLPVPKPLAANICQYGLTYTGALITYKIKDAVSLADSDEHNLWEKVGGVIRQFHDKQIYHADLNAHNILISHGDIYVIDFDKGKRKSAFSLPFWKKQNLRRLKSSLNKLQTYNNLSFNEKNWQMLIQGYNA